MKNSGDDIKKIEAGDDLQRCARVIAESFKTVAEEFHLTKENAPTNPAFITLEKLREYLKKDISLYGYYKKQLLIGCIAIEKSHTEKDVFFIERLAVIPGERHQGYGTDLLRFALNTIKEKNGKKASIGIINENKRLKKWYEQFGFHEVQVKEFNHLPFTVCFMEARLEAGFT